MDHDYRQLANQIDNWVQEHREEYISDLIDFVNIRSVKEAPTEACPFGKGVERAIDRALEWGKEYHIETENDGYYNVSFLERGKSEKELAILGHLDVVPEGEGWDYEPYQAIYKEGHVIGRGSSDNKGPALVALYTLRVLRDLGISLNHTLRIMWGGNEESGMEDIPHFLAKHTAPEATIVCDCIFPLCYGEKGILNTDLLTQIDDERLVDFNGGVASNSIPDTAYILIRENWDTVKEALVGQNVTLSQEADGMVRIQATGIAGHASFPDKGESAIQKLAVTVAGSGLFQGKTQRAIQFIAEAFADSHGEGLDIDIRDDIGTDTTHIGGYIRLEGQTLRQNINVRYAIGADQQELEKRLRERVEKAGFSIENYNNMPPRYDRLDDPIVQILLGTVQEVAGETAKPFTMGGGTHARKMPHAIPYGPGSMTSYLAKPRFGRAHGANEAVGVDSILSAVKVYAIALIRLDEYFSKKER